LRLAERYCCRFGSSGMFYLVDWSTVTDVSKDPCAFLLSRYHVTSQKTRIFSNANLMILLSRNEFLQLLSHHSLSLVHSHLTNSQSLQTNFQTEGLTTKLCLWQEITLFCTVHIYRSVRPFLFHKRIFS
jgi:hypothetical protein